MALRLYVHQVDLQRKIDQQHVKPVLLVSMAKNHRLRSVINARQVSRRKKKDNKTVKPVVQGNMLVRLVLLAAKNV